MLTRYEASVTLWPCLKSMMTISLLTHHPTFKIFHSLVDYYNAVLALKKPGGSVTVLRSKDRVFKPLPSGYRDVLLNITIEGCDMVMELQLHLKDGKINSI